MILLNRAMILLVAAALVSACSKTPSEPAELASAETETPAPSEPANAQIEESSALASLTLAGISIPLGFEHKILSDTVVEMESGVRQQKVFIEAAGLDAQSLQDSMTAALANEGFTVASTRPSSGGQRVDFSNEQSRRIIALFRPRLGKDKAPDPNVGVAQLTVTLD